MEKRLRLLVTHQCNYNCDFCHKEGVMEHHNSLLTPQDYEFLFLVAKKHLGITNVNISGGEPLLRNDIEDIVKRLYDYGANINITTNGLLLNKYIELGKFVRSFNISYHSTNKSEYEKIVGKSGTFERVTNNIKLMRQVSPQTRIKLNTVFTNEVYQDKQKLYDLIKFANETGCVIKFIEVFPKQNEYYIPIKEMEDELILLGYDKNKREDKSNTSIRSDVYKNGVSEIILERCLCSVAEEQKQPKSFCNRVNDIYVTADANVRFCRIRNDQSSILKLIKDRDEQSLSVKLKDVKHNLAFNCAFEEEKEN